MTKTDARQRGHELATTVIARVTDEDFFRKSYQEIHELALNAANGYATGVNRGASEHAEEVRTVFRHAFVQTYTSAWNNRASALPDVIAQRRYESMAYRLNHDIKNATELIEKFKARLDSDPCDAFEWAGQVMEAAAKMKVATVLKMVLETKADDGEDGGVDGVRRYATGRALNGARYPHHSTSVTSNVMKEYLTAAYAEYANHNRD